MDFVKENYDVVVVGAGHAGCEAALACARLGLETILFTISVDSIAMMPCNPNIGGSSKGHLFGPRQIRLLTVWKCEKLCRIPNILRSVRQRLPKL